MIILAKAVSYGGNSLRYAMEKENAKTVKLNYLPDGLDPTAIWYILKHHCLLTSRVAPREGNSNGSW